MSIVLTSGRTGVRLTSGRTGVTVTSSRPRIALTADRQGRPGADGAQGPAGEGAVKVDWLVRRFGSGTPALDPVGDFANWEAAAPAYWNLSDGDDFAFYDTLDRTQSGIYTYTAGVGVARKTGYTTTASLHRTAAAGKLYRNHLDDTVWSTPAFTTGFVVFLAADDTQALGTAEWYVNWLVDDRTFSVVTDHIADTTSVHGIADTSALETTTGAQAKVDAHVNDTSAAHTPQAVDAQPAIAIATFDTSYTITNESFVGTFGNAVTFPLASTRDGETITIYPLASDATLSTTSPDVFNPPGAGSVAVKAGDVLSYTAVAALGIWVPAIRSGTSFDLPGWVSTPPTDNSVVYYNSGNGFPTWTLGNSVGYTPNVSADWAATPSNIGAALDELADRTTTLEENERAEVAFITVGAALQAAPADATSYWWGGAFSDVPATSTTDPWFAVVAPAAGRITGAVLHLYADTAGTGEDWTMYVAHSGTDYSVATQSVTTKARKWVNTGLNITVAAGDVLYVREDTPTWATNPTNVRRTGYLIFEY